MSDTVSQTVQVTLPEMGESVAEGSIVEWRKRVGDFVAEGDALVDVTTDKVDVEVPATASGVIAQILAAAGDTVAVGAVLAEIDTSRSNGHAAGAASNGAPAAAVDSVPVVVTLPEMGESVTEGSVVEVRRAVGDWVEEGDVLIEVTTDKVDVEVPAPSAGRVVRIDVKAGDTVSVGAALLELDAGGAAPTKSAAPKTAAPPRPAPTAEPAAPARSDAPADPQARRIARKLDVDLALVRGSGPDGLILRYDVVSQAERARRRPAAVATQQTAFPIPAGANVTPLRGPAAALTSYMDQSLTIPTATSFRTLAVDVLEARRAELNAALRAAGRSEKISFTHLIAYALVSAAHEMPFVTYSFRRDENGAPLRVEPGIHLGLAVDSERKDGSRFLVVPVIKNAAALD
ncbi:MAG TPA: biotin/lipoyl-containing protein, partial [Candidatus Tumulicola sp.]